MGLLSFIKGAGQKLFGKKTEEVAKIELSEREKKVNALNNEIARLNLPIAEPSIAISEMITVSGAVDTNADREKIILALGNVEGIGCVDDNISVMNPEPESTFHFVKEGDSLSKISKEVYGDPMKYQLIFEANQPMLEHPDKIYPGQNLRIPALNA